MTLKTFIKWSGNKSKHLNKILTYIPSEYNTYIKPFVGSGALFLRLEPKKWLINDLNKDCINIWNNIKENPKDIISEFKNFGKIFKPLTVQKKKEVCIEITKNINEMKYDIDRAITFLIMKYCAYMGHIFGNNKFYFFGLDMQIYINNNYTFLNDRNYTNIMNVSQFLTKSSGHISNTDYKQILLKARRNDFVFLDPPYIEDHNYQFNYNKGEKLDDNFLKELYNEVGKLNNKGVKWMMTQADTKSVRELFKKYTIKSIPVHRRSGNKHVNELLIMNY